MVEQEFPVGTLQQESRSVSKDRSIDESVDALHFRYDRSFFKTQHFSKSKILHFFSSFLKGNRISTLTTPLPAAFLK